jgi:integrase
VFLTRLGQPWGNEEAAGSPISAETAKLLKGLKLHRPGLNFYALRHTFETIAGETADQVAVNAIMGHTDESMAGAYRERIGDDRLQVVTNHVRGWLWPKAKPKPPAKRKRLS